MYRIQLWEHGTFTEVEGVGALIEMLIDAMNRGCNNPIVDMATTTVCEQLGGGEGSADRLNEAPVSSWDRDPAEVVAEFIEWHQRLLDEMNGA